MIDVLLVDDEEFVLRTIGPALEQAGFGVRTATTVAAVFAAVAERAPDVIVMDMNIGSESGIDAIVALRQIWPQRRIRIVVLSGQQDLVLVQRVLACGVDDYLIKSQFSFERLCENLRASQDTEKNGLGTAAPQAEGIEAGRPAHDAQPIGAPTAPRNAQSGVNTVLSGAGFAPHSPPSSQTLFNRLRMHAAAHAYPGTVNELIRISGSRDARRADLVEVAKRDPVLSVRIIRASNVEALHHDKPRVSDVDGAIKLLGFARIKEIATRVSLFSRFAVSSHPGCHPVHAIQHAVLVASLCEKLAPDAEEKSFYQLMGLCHLLPELILREVLPEEFSAIDERVAAGSTRQEAMREELPAGAAELAEAAMASLGASEDLVRVVCDVYGKSSIPADIENAAGILRLAQDYAHAMLVTWDRCAEIESVGPDLLRPLESRLDAIDWRRLRSDALLSSASIIGAMEGSPATSALFPLRFAPVLRISPTKRPIDPLWLLLEHLATPVNQESIPRAEVGWGNAMRAVVFGPPDHHAALAAGVLAALAHAPAQAKVMVVPAAAATLLGGRVHLHPGQHIRLRSIDRFMD